ncbi:DUF697 domain-containing protein [Staphylococcus equorum]|uniref:DUF697 domain-containing protein n=1 Tax=Staphylococcus equorum TaxID=246432 RepID=UPI0008062CDD|nr:DUF697 domain-containing protein [Staphylococcus equorum]ANQ63870.1 hypothetical protein AVJ22_04025 [Staphylococcus equorum]
MSFKNKITNNVTQKVGNKVLNIEDIKNKGSIPTTHNEIEERRQRAEALVRKKSMLSSGVSVVPIPGLGFSVDIKLMKDIIEDVNKIYGLNHKQVNTMGDDMKERVLTTAAIQGSQFIGKKVSSAILKVVIRDVAKRTAAKQTKWFPVIGQAITASISYYFMKKIGNDHIQKCEKVAKSLV